jgi:hypothetical protein
MRKFKKSIFISLGTILSLAVLIIVFISPITKYLIEKYDTKYIGREVTLDWAYVNPFTGYIYLNDVKVYEFKSDSLFIAMNGLSINVGMVQLFSQNIELDDLSINHPQVIIANNNLKFNFDDLVRKFSSTGPKDSAKKSMPVSILNIQIKDGHFHYVDPVIPVDFSIKSVYIASKQGWHSDSDNIAATFAFLSEAGTGGMKGNFGMDLNKLDYKLDVKVSKFDLKVIEQYLKGFSNYGTLRANLEADLKTVGNFNDAQNISISGALAISDFHFGKNFKEDYLSFDKVSVNIKEVNPKKRIYFLDSMSLMRPYFKYEQYDYSNNLETMFGKNGANATATNVNATEYNIIFTIGRYVEQLAKNFLKSNYKVNKLGIYKCNLEYNDYTLAEKFSIILNPLEIKADSIYKTKARVNLRFTSGIEPYGNGDIRLSINPKDTSNFDLYYHFQKLPLTMFNPYMISYTSFPLNRGTLEFNGAWRVRNGNIQSTNHLLLIDPRLSKRVRQHGLAWIPMRIIMAFVRERGNVVDYEIPITGNLNEPKFHWRDVIIDIVENIFVKPVTTPYRLKVRNVESEIEHYLSFNWDLEHSTLQLKQQNFLKHMAAFLNDHPKVIIVVKPQNYLAKEKEHILFFEAKKFFYSMYYHKNVKTFGIADTNIINKMSIKDTLFTAYLRKQIKNPMAFSIQDKCSLLVGPSAVNVAYAKLAKERQIVFMACFKKYKVEKQIHFSTAATVIPYNGLSYYKINYADQLPPSLIKAYNQMTVFNNLTPRLRFKKDRQKNGQNIE